MPVSLTLIGHLLVVAFVLVGVGICVQGWVQAVTILVRERTWTPVQAVVDDVTVTIRETADDRFVETAVRYRYRAGGGEFEGAGDLPPDVVATEGGVLKIFVDPRRPSRSVIAGYRAKLALVLVPLMLVVFVLFSTALLPEDLTDPVAWGFGR